MACSPKKLITVLTPTFNRAHMLPDLYRSLCEQSNHAFDWLIVDDGSTDETGDLVSQWQKENNGFHIDYFWKENDGKNRSINKGVSLIETPFTMILDSDDILTHDAIAFLSKAALDVTDMDNIAGIAALRGTDADTPLQEPAIPPGQFIMANNLERARYQLSRDACEVYKTALLRKYPFVVWPKEKFIPEEIVWDTIALDGFCLRWYHKVTCIVRYQIDGLSATSQKLQQNNPMGYASLFKHRVSLYSSFRQRLYWNSQLFAQCFLGRHLGYGLKENLSLCSLLSLPIGGVLAIRRIFQFRNVLPPKDMS